MFIILLLVHIVASVFLILMVLLQSGKAGDLASAFGGASSQSAFGARSASDFLTKATSVSAVLFMITSLGLALMYTGTLGGEGTVLDDIPAAQSEPAQPDATPAATPAAPAEKPTGGQDGAGATGDPEKPPEGSGPGN